MIKNHDDYVSFNEHKQEEFEKIKYPEQLAKKQSYIEELFGKKANPIIPNPKPRGYRHKAVLSATNIRIENKLHIRLGLFEEGTRKIKPKNGHFLHDSGIDEIFKTIEKLLIKYKFKAYHERSNDGIIKHVLIRKSYKLGEYLVVYTTNGNLFPNNKDMIKELISVHPEVKTVVQNIQNKQTKFVLLEDEKILYGKGYISDFIGDLEFQISARAFYQVNPMQMLNLYEKALEMAKISKDDVVLDCYSGIGTITLLASKYAKEVYGFEINDSSVKDAINNKKINNIQNVKFFNGDVEKLIEEFDKKIDLLIMDPTRDGASLKFIQTVLKIKPKKILYISCDPFTQKRDYAQMGRSYEIVEIQPVDMFSYTSHVENIVLLTLKS